MGEGGDGDEGNGAQPGHPQNWDPDCRRNGMRFSYKRADRIEMLKGGNVHGTFEMLMGGHGDKAFDGRVDGWANIFKKCQRPVSHLTDPTSILSLAYQCKQSRKSSILSSVHTMANQVQLFVKSFEYVFSPVYTFLSFNKLIIRSLGNVRRLV